jgi:hypothetical protein
MLYMRMLLMLSTQLRGLHLSRTDERRAKEAEEGRVKEAEEGKVKEAAGKKL